MYCPNCSGHVLTDATHCMKCHADFGADSGWRPVPHSRTRSPDPTPIFSRQPKLIHAAQSIAMFAFAGPIVGLLVLAARSEARGTFLAVMHPFAIIGAFSIGMAPAFLAGVLYCALTLVVVALFPKVSIGVLWGASLGALTGGVATATLSHLLLADTPNYSVKFNELVSLSIPAGVVAGIVCGWLLPVGRRRVGASTEKHAG